MVDLIIETPASSYKRPQGLNRNGGIMKNLICLTLSFLLLICSISLADSEELKLFKASYDRLNIDLLNTTCEVVEIDSFVYQKDLATFSFKNGTFYFLRYVDGRPTTAIFSGEGTATVSVPTDIERNSLRGITGDSLVNETFKSCFIRFGDNLDEKVMEHSDPERTKLSWKIYNIAKQEQGEVFFRPIIQHRYDSYFQLLRSAYERYDDGFFWIDFNRYVFTYDPNQPEQFRLAYEFEGGDFAATDAVILQRQETAIYDNLKISEINYPTTCLSRQAKISMGGADGSKIDEAESNIKVVVNRDSLKYVSLFLNYNLKEDSIYYGDEKVDYKRRKDFDFIGIILPEYQF